VNSKDGEFTIHTAGGFHHVKEFLPVFIQFPGPTSRQAILYYRAEFEAQWHPVPLVVHRGKLTGLIQPFLAGTQVQYYAILEELEGGAVRVPKQGTFSYKVRRDWGSRLRRRIRTYTK
jgi:hypothetical protein